jgi:DNA-binding LacI/PurR family transcriptional regulator
MIKLNNRSLVYQDIRKKIADDIFSSGSSLPSLRALSGEYKTSVGTIRQALDQLRIERFVESRHGKGNYVTEAQVKVKNVMLITELEGDVFQDLVNAFSSNFNAHPGYHLLLEKAPNHNKLDEALLLEKKIQNLILTNNLDAVFFDGADIHKTDFLGKYLDDVNIYCFYNGANLAKIMYPHVISDWFHGGYIGIRHLHDVGCRKVLVITHRLDLYRPENVVNTFLEGCRRAAEDTGIKILGMHHQAEDADYANEFFKIMKANPDIDGIYAFGDFRMCPLYPVLRKLDLTVGKDIAALGYYDTPLAQAFDPALSSVNTLPGKIVNEACKLYFNKNKNNNCVRIPPEIVVRKSSKLADFQPIN